MGRCALASRVPASHAEPVSRPGSGTGEEGRGTGPEKWRAGRDTAGRRSGLLVGRLLGVDIRLHWTFLALIGVVVLANAGSGARSVCGALLWVMAVFGSVLLHEVAHCLVARHRGAVVEDILLTPVAGLSRMHDVPTAPSDELTIAAAGPLLNLALALLLAGVGLGLGGRLWPPTLFAGAWVARLLWLNVLLGGFNLLPAIPMDGGWVLRSILERTHDRRAAANAAARVSRVLAMTMVLVGILFDVWLALIGLLLLVMASGPQPPSDSDGARRRPDGTAGTAPGGDALPGEGRADARR
jgi:Zn-dependent protease